MANGGTCPAGVQPASNGKFWISLASFTLALTAFLGGIALWFIDAKIASGYTKVQADIMPVFESIRETNRLMDRRIVALENNTIDRWTATHQYQLMMELKEELRNAGVEITHIDPYEVKRHSGPQK